MEGILLNTIYPVSLYIYISFSSAARKFPYNIIDFGEIRYVPTRTEYVQEYQVHLHTSNPDGDTVSSKDPKHRER